MANIKFRTSNSPANIPTSTTVKGEPLDNAEIDGNFKSLQDAVVARAPLVSPAFTGTPTSTTPTQADNSTRVATTAFVQGVVGSAELPVARITGTLPINRGGTGTTATPTAGSVAVGNGTTLAYTAPGIAGQVLVSNGAGIPTFQNISQGENNTASNLGSGAGIFASKIGVDLRFKSLVAGNNITLDESANTITINSTGGGSGGGGPGPTTLNIDSNNNIFTCNTTPVLSGGSSTATRNIFLGGYSGPENAGTYGFYGNGNIAIGNYAASGICRSASNNIFLGNYAGSYGLRGCCNILIGNNAGNYIGQFDFCNTIIGHSGVYGIYNTVIIGAGGVERLRIDSSGLCVNGQPLSGGGGGNGSGSVNGITTTLLTSIGCESGTTGTQNTFIGAYAGVSNSAFANSNTFVGHGSGVNSTTGFRNTFLGNSTGQNNSTGSSNTFLGESSGFSNTTGCCNIFIGTSAGTFNTTGSNNTIIGHCGVSGLNNTVIIGAGGTERLRIDASGICVNGQPLSTGGGGGPSLVGCTCSFITSLGVLSGTAGTQNTYIGVFSGNANTSGCYNTFLGHCSGRLNTTGMCNVFIGNRAGDLNVNGLQNTFVGAFAGCLNTQSANTFIGALSGRINTTGANNTFIGNSTGSSNTTGTHNTFIGSQAGFNNTTARNNTFVGHCAGFYNTTGGYNVFMGQLAGRHNSTGSSNTFTGQYSGFCNTTGSNNTFIGIGSGRQNTIGEGNIFLGAFAGFYNTTGSNNLLLGRNAGITGFSPNGLSNITTESNRIILGNAEHTCAQIQIAWTVVSDERDKNIIRPVPHGLGFLSQLEPIEYEFKNRETGEVKDTRTRYGFSAQNILSAEEDHPVIVSVEDPDKLQVTHEYLLPVMVNAIKELKDMIEDLEYEIRVLKGIDE